MREQFVIFLRKHKLYVTALILGALLQEPWLSIKSGLLCPTSWKRHCNFHGMNPTALTKEQLNRRPILLLHGNYHNQSAWLSLAKNFALNNPIPLFTVNLPSGVITDRDFEIISKKMEEIRALYQSHTINPIKVDLVGHSRGGTLARQVAYLDSESIGKVISMGSTIDREEIDNMQRREPNYSDHLYEITGKYDILETAPSLLPPSNHAEIEEGHLGLLYASEAHQRIMDWLK